MVAFNEIVENVQERMFQGFSLVYHELDGFYIVG